ncbi:hypothetical protein U8607_12450 [Methylobacterium durans]|uniref:hypothetical protein n=1 Tax=Methylobacterium durans TaxID=2202825 RepID=UPI002AFFC29C|nr:hypothetical protein [Methylobacterium durans]MEA1832892.1 hypothetical protein [Methylobacterium durans]
MQDAHTTLMTALRSIIADGADPRPVIARAIAGLEAERPRPAAPHREMPGPYAPNAWSIYAGR